MGKVLIIGAGGVGGVVAHKAAMEKTHFSDVMLASLAVIGCIGFLFEKLVFGSLERATILRWGMVQATKV